ncbi:MAG: hypothetical protein U5K81_02685 [Trueperaceae bacterium]|nr:hypothetical protein [Trueperaceae bacterium]
MGWEDAVCALLITLGSAMLLVGIVLIIRFFVGRGPNLPDEAGTGRTESMIFGALLVALGPLLLFLGLTEAVCRAFGLG